MEQLQNYIDAIVRTDWVTTAISAVVILAITAVVARLTRRFLGRVLAINEERDLPSSSIFINIARGAVWITGVCIMLSTCFRVDVSAAITALGIGGIAISLGFQDTLSNLIGGLQVSLLRIIKPGDNIEVGSSTGVVKDITWRHTTIRNGAGEEVLIPNSIISKTALTHLPPTNQVSLAIVVTTEGQHLDEVAEAIERKAGEAAAGIGKVVKQPKLTFSEICGFHLVQHGRQPYHGPCNRCGAARRGAADPNGGARSRGAGAGGGAAGSRRGRCAGSRRPCADQAEA